MALSRRVPTPQGGTSAQCAAQGTTVVGPAPGAGGREWKRLRGMLIDSSASPGQTLPRLPQLCLPPAPRPLRPPGLAGWAPGL